MERHKTNIGYFLYLLNFVLYDTHLIPAVVDCYALQWVGCWDAFHITYIYGYCFRNMEKNERIHNATTE